MPPPTMSAEELIDYVKTFKEQGAVVTINMGIYQDGTVGEKSAEIMRQLRRTIRN